MGFRIRKSIKLLPGIRLNLSKTGVSTSIGRRGMTVNVGHGKARTTVGVPGTGISYSNTTSAQHDAFEAGEDNHDDTMQAPRGTAFLGLIKVFIGLAALLVIVSLLQANPELLMSWVLPISSLFGDGKTGVLAAVLVPGCLYILWRIFRRRP